MTAIVTANPISAADNTSNLTNLNSDKLEKPSETHIEGALLYQDATAPNTKTSATLLVWDGTQLHIGGNSPTKTLDITGTLGVSGTATFAGAATVGTTLSVTGDATFDTTTLFVDATNNSVNVGSASHTTSAIMALTSTVAGFRPPLMSEAQRDAIGTPAEGLTIANSTNKGLNYYDGSAWTTTGGLSGLTQGSVVFADSGGSATEDNTNFFWDDTNNRLCIGTNTSVNALTVVGTASMSTGVTIGATALDGSALLEVTSTTKGFLGPRMTTTQRDAIGTPATGLMIYNTTTNQYENYNGSAWIFAGSSSALTAGSVLFAGSSGEITQDNASLFFDDSNNRLGVLDATPSYTVDVAGIIRATGNIRADADIDITTTTGALQIGSADFAHRPGTSNTFIGELAGGSYSSNTHTTLVGYNAGNAISANINNTIVGSTAGQSTTGTGNTFMGTGAGFSNTTGADNVYIGLSAARLSTGAQKCTVVGYNAGRNNTSSTLCVLGYQAGTANTSGTGNTFLGYYSGGTNTTGSNNTFVGLQAGIGGGLTGSNNTALGSGAGDGNISGGQNTMIGEASGQAITSGSNNTLLGRVSGNALTTGGTNTFLGHSAGRATGTGDGGNVFIGNLAGDTASGSNQLMIDIIDSATSLIEGDFSGNTVTINGDQDITGTLAVGVASASGTVHADQASTSGAQPVIYLDQADVSEEFIRFDATEATGNSIEDVGAKTLTTTKFIRININGVDLYLQAGTIA